MSDNLPPFRSVMRGWDPTQVEATLGELNAALEAARREAADRTVELSKFQSAHAELSSQLDAAHARIGSLEEAERTASSTTTNFQELGDRIGKILHLADQEATDMRATAQMEAEDHRASAAAAADAARAEADRYVEDARTRADAEAATVLEDAKRRADAMIDEADRAATARREEAEALYESQRAKVSAAAADFETTLAARRDKAAQEFSAQLATHEQSLTEVQARSATLSQEAETAHAEAKATAAHILESARAEAAQHLQTSREQAERVRVESDRELAAATARRDSINAQLANVRQMLATLGGAALAQHLDPEPATEAAAPADAEPVVLAKGHAEDETRTVFPEGAEGDPVADDLEARQDAEVQQDAPANAR